MTILASFESSPLGTLCPQCGHDQRGTLAAGGRRCSECGLTYQYAQLRAVRSWVRDTRVLIEKAELLLCFGLGFAGAILSAWSVALLVSWLSEVIIQQRM